MKTFIVLFSISFSLNLLAGGEKGNGGGAWGCFTSDSNELVWLRLLDTFEAEFEFGNELISSQHLPEVNRMVSQRLKRYSQKLYKSINSRLDFMQEIVFYTDAELDEVNDHFYRVRPNSSSCLAGSIQYVQVANMTNDHRLMISKKYYHFLSRVDQLALFYHEAIYYYLRDKYEDINSKRAREIVGLLFSKITDDELRKKLDTIFAIITEQSLGLKFEQISRGRFWFGGPAYSEDEVVLYEPGGPRHIHYDFEIMTTEVTQEMYVKLMGHNPSYHKSTRYCPEDYTMINGISVCPFHPVENVTQKQILDFFDKLNSSTSDKYYRLPSEMEWEYAVRSSSLTKYFFGDDFSFLNMFAVYFKNSESSTQQVATVRSFSNKANTNGLFDVLGNVYEWTISCDKSYVLKGGSWKSGPVGLTSYHRRELKNTEINKPRIDAGFRIVKINSQ